jgi:hypothetical protein
MSDCLNNKNSLLLLLLLLAIDFYEKGGNVEFWELTAQIYFPLALLSKSLLLMNE